MLAAALLVGAQLVLFARSEVAALRLQWQGRQWLSAESVADVAFIPIAAARSLGALAESIPLDARVLLVTPSPFVAPYDFYLLPRRLTVLMRVDETLIDKAEAAYPATVRQARRWIDELRARGQALSVERLRQELPRADYVITFLGDAALLHLRRPDVLPEGLDLEPVTRSAEAALYRVVRG